MPAGRPSKYSPELADTICARIINGESLRSICSDEAMPGMTTVIMWLRLHEEFQKQYAHARDSQADTYADEITYIADTEEDPNKARVRIDARKWVASKLKPKKYGNTIDVTSDGKALPTPIIPLDVPTDDSNQ